MEVRSIVAKVSMHLIPHYSVPSILTDAGLGPGLQATILASWLILGDTFLEPEEQHWTLRKGGSKDQQASRSSFPKSSTSILIICSPGTTISPRYRLVMSTLMVSAVFDEAASAAIFTALELGCRYSKAWKRMMLHS